MVHPAATKCAAESASTPQKVNISQHVDPRPARKNRVGRPLAGRRKEKYGERTSLFESDIEY